MAKFSRQIQQSILGGIMPTDFIGRADEYFYGAGIDPEFPIANSGTFNRSSGAVMPVSFVKFSGAGITGWPLWFLTSPKNTKVYAYMSDGKVYSYDGALGSETSVGTPTSGAGNGAAYYNNYHYFATPTDISRYGPLDNSPTLANTFWSSTLSKTALTNTTYPSFANFPYPNHVMHVHSDNKLYIADFVNGQGQIHFIKTKKVTAEGDTDDGSSYGALKLPIGMKPVDIESYGTDLAILAFSGDLTGANTPKQGFCAMYLWDTSSPNFYREIAIPTVFASAVVNKNGELFLFAGNDISIGYEVLRFLGGYSFEAIFHTGRNYAPAAGAVDVHGSRLLWGDKLEPSPSETSSNIRASMFTLGSEDARLGARSFHSIANLSADPTQNPSVSALKMVHLNNPGIGAQPIVGWGSTGSTVFGIDKLSSNTSAGIFITRPLIIGQKYKISKIRLNLTAAVDANCSIVVKLMHKGSHAVTTVRTINNTNDAGKTTVTLYPNFVGEHSVAVVLEFTNTSYGPGVLLPITVEGETLSD